LTAIGQISTEAVPTAFNLDPEGKFLFVGDSESDRLTSYRVNDDAGELTALETYSVGRNPMWVLMTSLEDWGCSWDLYKRSTICEIQAKEKRRKQCLGHGKERP
jgi:hypothetical protein